MMQIIAGISILVFLSSFLVLVLLVIWVPDSKWKITKKIVATVWAISFFSMAVTFPIASAENKSVELEQKP